MNTVPTEKRNGRPGDVWINPVGGQGDTLMVSGVLKLVHDAHPDVKYRCIRRTNYAHLLTGHPALESFGFPPADATIITTDYWSHGQLGPGNNRAFQILARMFGLTTPVQEVLYLPPVNGEEEDLSAFVPWGKKNIIIAPASDSPRKMMPPQAWEQITDLLAAKGCSVFQVGREKEPHIKGTYSLVGLTSPRQLAPVVARADAVITVDNFCMHMAHLEKKLAVVVWGPTDPQVYGYEGHVHIRGTLDQCDLVNKCLGPQLSRNYPTPCPKGPDQCMATIPVKKIVDTVVAHLYI
jgi:ADP-heptose:LPS heptosyltransferase